MVKEVPPPDPDPPHPAPGVQDAQLVGAGHPGVAGYVLQGSLRIEPVLRVDEVQDLNRGLVGPLGFVPQDLGDVGAREAYGARVVYDVDKVRGVLYQGAEQLVGEAGRAHLVDGYPGKVLLQKGEKAFPVVGPGVDKDEIERGISPKD